MRATPAPATPAQLEARARWQGRWGIPILLAAFLPLFINSPDARGIEVAVGVGSWLVFVIDLVVQRRIDPAYLRRRNGRIDIVIVLLTFPFYLLPGAQGASVLFMLARLGRVARVLMATAGLRRLAERLGKVAIIAGVIVTVASLAAYQAENPENKEFATIGDAFWWGIVTLTTVGYGDIVPETRAGRFAGMAIMFTGVAVLGVLAGSLSSLFGTDSPDEEPDASDRSVHAELAALERELQEMHTRVGALAVRAQSEPVA